MIAGSLALHVLQASASALALFLQLVVVLPRLHAERASKPSVASAGFVGFMFSMGV